MVACPGCGSPHAYDTRWEFNGSMDAPTFTPSYKATKETGGKPFVCHSFLTGGVYQFLDDCTHEYAGKSVPVKDVDTFAKMFGGE